MINVLHPGCRHGAALTSITAVSAFDHETWLPVFNPFLQRPLSNVLAITASGMRTVLHCADPAAPRRSASAPPKPTQRMLLCYPMARSVLSTARRQRRRTAHAMG